MSTWGCLSSTLVCVLNTPCVSALPLHTATIHCHYTLPLYTATTHCHYTLPLYTATIHCHCRWFFTAILMSVIVCWCAERSTYVVVGLTCYYAISTLRGSLAMFLSRPVASSKRISVVFSRLIGRGCSTGDLGSICSPGCGYPYGGGSKFLCTWLKCYHYAKIMCVCVCVCVCVMGGQQQKPFDPDSYTGLSLEWIANCRKGTTEGTCHVTSYR